MIFAGHPVFRDGTNAEEAAGARETNHDTEAKVPEKNKTSEVVEKKSARVVAAKKSAVKKAAKKSAAPKDKKTAEKKASKRAGRAERLSAEQIAGKRDEMKSYLSATSDGATPKMLKDRLGVNANQLRRILGGCDGVEKVGTVGPAVKYKLAG